MDPLDVLREAPPATLPIDILRAVAPSSGIQMRADGDAAMPTMAGHFSVFNVWYEVNSWLEGHFLERLVPGAFKKTIRESRDAMKVLYDHGMDPQIGNKVLGPIDDLREDAVGPAYEVPLLDTSYNRDLVPGLEAGLYGSSFRFRVVQDKWNMEPGVSDHNPGNLPERSITETRVFEFGPVTFPANPAATAGIRSITDDYYDHLRATSPERFDELLRSAQAIRTPAALGTGAATRSDEPAPATRRTPKDVHRARFELDEFLRTRQSTRSSES